MALDGQLWRDASLSGDVADFLERTGARLLAALDASTIVVRVVDAVNDQAQHHIDTVAAIRRGAVGVAYSGRARTPLGVAAMARLRSEARLDSPNRSS